MNNKTPIGDTKMNFDKIRKMLDRAEQAGAGGKQRELVEEAMRLMADGFIETTVGAGHRVQDAVDVITELAEDAGVDYGGIWH